MTVFLHTKKINVEDRAIDTLFICVSKTLDFLNLKTGFPQGFSFTICTELIYK